jgi:hypothetical protein
MLLLLHPDAHFLVLSTAETTLRIILSFVLRYSPPSAVDESKLAALSFDRAVCSVCCDAPFKTCLSE